MAYQNQRNEGQRPLASPSSFSYTPAQPPSPSYQYPPQHYPHHQQFHPSQQFAPSHQGPPSPPFPQNNTPSPELAASAFSKASPRAPVPPSPTAPVPLSSFVNRPSQVQEFPLDPPQRSFVTFEGGLSSPGATTLGDRPTSVASFSNISTHSNEPLNPSIQNNPNLRSKLGSKKKFLAPTKKAKFNMEATRSLTPQPWHPDYNNRDSTVNPLDLPEDRNRHRDDTDDDTESETDDHPKRGKSPGNSNGSNEKNGPVLNKTRKNIFSRLRRSRTKVTYKVTGTGRYAQFSNERLYLHWIRFGILQGTIAVTLLSFGNNIVTSIGVGALILALTTLIYGTTLYHLRHLYMITKRKDVVYYARTIPTLLCLGLIAVYLANFILTMTIGEDARSSPPWPADDNFGHYF